jgi:transposase, IS30 family
MARAGRPAVPVEVHRVFWSGIRAGLTVEESAAVVGVSVQTGYRWFGQRGGVMPVKTAPVPTRSLCFAEREEIAERRAAGQGVRAIARALGRDPSTISRELRRVKHDRAPGDRHKIVYRASTAQADADVKAKRSGPAKLATNLRLRREVQNRLKRKHSPVQIARRLRLDFPDDPEMWVSHETIYQSLYVQSRGGLKRELTRHLRTGRALRKPRRKTDERRGRIPDMVNISERPPEADDRRACQIFCVNVRYLWLVDLEMRG